MVEMLPILNMGYYAAKHLGIPHLHVLHILDFLLAYRYHGVRLCKADERCVIEHSSNDSGSFDQPTLSVQIKNNPVVVALTRLREIMTSRFAEMDVSGPVVALCEAHYYPKHRTSPSISSTLRTDSGCAYGLVVGPRTAASSARGNLQPYPISIISGMSRFPRVQAL